MASESQKYNWLINEDSFYRSRVSPLCSILKSWGGVLVA